jgi:hypothetical protein
VRLGNLTAYRREFCKSLNGVPVRLCNYTDIYNNEFITDDMTLMEATATPSEIRRFTLYPGDVVITKDSESWDDIAVPACISERLNNVICGSNSQCVAEIVTAESYDRGRKRD